MCSLSTGKHARAAGGLPDRDCTYVFSYYRMCSLTTGKHARAAGGLPDRDCTYEKDASGGEGAHAGVLLL